MKAGYYLMKMNKIQWNYNTQQIEIGNEKV